MAKKKKMAKKKNKTETEQIEDMVAFVRQVADDERSEAEAASALARAKKAIQDRDKFTLVDVTPVREQTTCF